MTSLSFTIFGWFIFRSDCRKSKIKPPKNLDKRTQQQKKQKMEKITVTFTSLRFMHSSQE